MKNILLVISLLACLSLYADKKPNIVFIFADDLGYGDLANYGHPYARTPNLDNLAKQGTSFKQFYVSGVTCCPSRTGFMTGLHTARFEKYPSGHGFSGKTTITELLKKNGYTTGHFGKWHIGPETENQYGIDVYKSAGDKSDPRGRDADVFDVTIDFIKKNKDKPFYINVWGHITHYPVNAPDELAAMFKDVTVNRNDFSKTMQSKFDECERIKGDINVGMREYLGEVFALDQAIGKLLKTLDDLKLTENTIVVFSSDHGPAPVVTSKGAKEFSVNMLGYAGVFRGGKHNQFEGGVRAPFIIRWPGRIKAGHIDTASVVSGLDWLPTLCTITDSKGVPETLDGEDVSDAWFGNDRIRTSPLFWRTSSTNASTSMRDGKWKLHMGNKRNGGLQLYDLTNDPSESKNIAKDHPDVVKKMSKAVKTWEAELPKSYIKIAKEKKKKKKK